MHLVKFLLSPAAVCNFLGNHTYIVNHLNGWLAFAPSKEKRLLGSSFAEGSICFDVIPLCHSGDAGSGKVSCNFLNCDKLCICI